MKYKGDKMSTYCEACRTQRRIERCRRCNGEGGSCYSCDRTGYMCERSNADPKHRWKKTWA